MFSDICDIINGSKQKITQVPILRIVLIWYDKVSIGDSFADSAESPCHFIELGTIMSFLIFF